MRNSTRLKALLFGTVMGFPLATVVSAEDLRHLPAGDLETALNAYAAQTGVPLALSARLPAESSADEGSSGEPVGRRSAFAAPCGRGVCRTPRLRIGHNRP